MLVSAGVVAALAVIAAGALRGVREIGHRAACTNSLRQLGAAVNLYLGDNGWRYFEYAASLPDGKLWYFGFEPWGSLGGKEGERTLDVRRGPLYPYTVSSGVEVCRAFPYASALWKPKFKGASWGYGFNIFLSGVRAGTLEEPSKVVVFGDCAQVNTFQAPASASNPMLEEFYMFDTVSRTAHFRHGGIANFLMADGHVEGLRMAPGTLDNKMPWAQVGRIAPYGSDRHLRAKR